MSPEEELAAAVQAASEAEEAALPEADGVEVQAVLSYTHSSTQRLRLPLTLASQAGGAGSGAAAESSCCWSFSRNLHTRLK